MKVLLITLLAALTLQIHHRQVPVIPDRDVAIATVVSSDGTVPEMTFRIQGLPSKALERAYVRDSLLYVRLDGRRIRDLRKPFCLRIRARGVRVEETGARLHRLACAVRTAGDDGVAAYRIPGLVTTKAGTLVAVYDIRHASSRDLQGDIDRGCIQAEFFRNLRYGGLRLMKELIVNGKVQPQEIALAVLSV